MRSSGKRVTVCDNCFSTSGKCVGIGTLSVASGLVSTVPAASMLVRTLSAASGLVGNVAGDMNM